MENYFPNFLPNANTVPLGNAKPFCLHLDWSTKTNKKILEKYYAVQDMPVCSMTTNPKFRWQEQDPKTGLDFLLWKQHSKKVKTADECDSNAIFVKSANVGGTCFLYEVMESICVSVQFQVNEESASYGWAFAGGCFEDGRISNYKWAVPGTEYSFDKLDFEVREYNASIAESIGSLFSLTGLFGLLSALCILGAIILAAIVVYQHFKSKGSDGVEKSTTGNVEMVRTGKDKHQILNDE